MHATSGLRHHICLFLRPQLYLHAACDRDAARSNLPLILLAAIHLREKEAG